LDEFEISAEIVALLDADFAISRNVMPVNRVGTTILVAVTKETDVELLTSIIEKTGCNVAMVISGRKRLRRALVRYYGLKE
jgi:type IV pilus assembly protein PilB